MSYAVSQAKKKLTPAQLAKYELDRKQELKDTGNGATPVTNNRLTKTDWYQTWTVNTPETIW